MDFIYAFLRPMRTRLTVYLLLIALIPTAVTVCFFTLLAQNIIAAFVPAANQVEALAHLSHVGKIALFATLVNALLVIFFTVVMTRRISLPLEKLTTAVGQMSSGNLDVRVTATNQFDEIDLLEAGFNEMANQLAQQLQEQDQLIQARTDQLMTAADVSRQIVQLQDPRDLLPFIVRTIQERFQFYFVGIFRVSEDRREQVLVAAAGHNSYVRLTNNTRIPIESHSIIGQVSRTLAPYIASDVRQDPFHLANPLLPNTQSELALPLQLNGQLLGVLDLQASEQGRFEASEIYYLLVVADQVSVALENARLFNEVQAYARDMVQAREVAEAANQAKTRFLANMSHELRTPLNAILGFTQVLERDGNLTKRQRDYLGIISRSGYHLLGLINDVLEMSKVEVGRVAVQEDVFYMPQFLQGVGEMFQLRAESKGLVLRVSQAGDVPPYIRADEGKLRQVLINLLGNALKFTQTGGISLRVGYEAGETAPCLHFAVEDTGSGIPHAALEEVFKPFVQTTVGAAQGEGTGLGLAITRQYIHLMGGEISIQSDLNHGTVVQFYIPFQTATAVDVQKGWQAQRIVGVRASSRQRENGTAVSYRILVADDQQENRLLLREWLTAVGFAVREAADGREAVAIWNDWQPHLIWMDMRMPVMDGYEASRLIKSSVMGQETVIIALTASTAETERALVLSSGCDGLVRKPVREPLIFEKMAEHLHLQYEYAHPAPLLSPSLPPVAPEGHTAVANPTLITLLTHLTPAQRQALRHAAHALDMEAAYQAIGTVQKTNPTLAQYLEELVNNFRFDALQTVLNEAFNDATDTELSS